MQSRQAMSNLNTELSSWLSLVAEEKPSVEGLAMIDTFDLVVFAVCFVLVFGVFWGFSGG